MNDNKGAFFPALNKHFVKSIEKVNVMLNSCNFLF